MDSTFPLSNQSSTCREGGQLCVIILSNRVVRQYRTCVVDLLGLGIYMCGVYYSIMCTTHPDLVPSFCAIPIFHFHLLVPSLFMLGNDSRGYSVY